MPNTAALWKRLCEQWSWVINGGALILGMFGGLCLVVATPLCAAIVLDCEQNGVFGGPIPFASEAWKRNSHVPFVRPIRMRMADDFIRSQQPVGKPRAEIEAALNAPDSPGPTSDQLSYYLGERAHWMGDEVMLLTFEFDGEIVSKATIETIYRDD